MRWFRIALAGWTLILSNIAACFDFNSSYYGVYEGPPDIYGCRQVYVVPQYSLLLLGVDIPMPIRFMPNTTGFRMGYCGAAVPLTGFTRVALTAADMPGLGATLSSYRLFSGDFNGDGKLDFLLQGDASARNSMVLLDDGAGVPRAFYNFHGLLAVAQFPLINIVDADLDGRADIVATAVDGRTTTYFGAVDGFSQIGTGNGGNTFNVNLVGSVDGMFRVDESGAATYGVEIFAAPGTAGVQPHISLNYSSGAGDGIAGPGWSIGGLSEITRCRQTVVQDNNATGITLGASDRFCLDGQRLILVSGRYGENGSTYRTEIDSYAVATIVNSAGSATGNPMGFKVERKDGSVSYYGMYSGSAGSDAQHVVLAGSKVLTWSIAHFADSVGNGIRFTYQNSALGNEHLISRIDYAYGSDRGILTSSNTYLQFDYETRPDSSAGFVGGVMMWRRQRLTSIHSFSSGREVRSYNLVYRTPDGMHAQSFVEKLFECVGSDCLSPTTFNWTLNNGGFAAGVIAGTVVGARLSTVRILDINGDGRSDLVYRSLTAPYPLYYRLSNGTGFGPAITLIPSSTKTANRDDLPIAVFDHNNDGRQDLLFVDAHTGTSPATFFAGTSGGFAGGVSWGDLTIDNPVAADISGDGIPDLAGTFFGFPAYRAAQRINSGGAWATNYAAQQSTIGMDSSVPKPSGCASPPIWVMPLGLMGDSSDFNGDGRVDFPAYASYRQGTNCNADYAGVALSAGGAGFTTLGWTPGIALPSADMNGDGLTDQWYKDPNGNRVLRFSTGTGFSLPLVIGGGDALNDMIYIDYNGDGYLDLLYPAPTLSAMVVRLFDPATHTYLAAISTGLPYQPQSGVVAADQYVALDVDGDGHTDLLRIANGIYGNIFTLYKSADNGVGNRIVRIDNGMGKATGIVYKPLTDASVYTRSTDANNASLWPGAPVFDVLAPTYVVATTNTSNPTAHATLAGAVDYGATSSISYQYAGLKLQARGRGPLGFGSIKSTDNRTGITTGIAYNLNFPFTGQPGWITTVKNNVAISSKVYTYAQIPHSSDGATTYYQIYASKIVEQTNDPVRGTETRYAVTENGVPDVWGNLPSTTTSIYPASSHTAYLTQQISTYGYGSAEDRRFGRLSGSSVTQKRSGEVDAVRTTAFTYYPSGQPVAGLLRTEAVSDPGGAPTQLITYEYDTWGNKSKTVQSAAGQASRYSKTTYDATGRFVATRSGEFLVNTDPDVWSERVIDSVISRTSSGQPTEINGPNGLITYFKYDALGREISRSDNTGAGSTTRHLRGGWIGAQLQVSTFANTGAETSEYFDALGRSIVKGQKGFDGRWIYSDTEYEGAGRVKRQSNPHYEGDTAYWTTSTYDAFRLLSQSAPASGGTTANTTFSYDGLTTIATNALGQTHAQTFNAAGELVSVTDPLGGVLSYSYTAAGDIASIKNTGVQNGVSTVVTTSLSYDGLGRKIQMVDSDKGTRFYSYNGFGDLVKEYKVMAGGIYQEPLTKALANSVPMQRTELTYDRRGRVVERNDYRENGVQGDSAFWIFDVADNGLGQLAQDLVSDRSVGHLYAYDRFGRQASKADVNDIWYIEEIAYDDCGRVATKTDAVGSNSGIRSIYNKNGYLQKLQDLSTNDALYQVQNMDALGNVVTATLGDGAATTRHFDQGSGLLLNKTAVVGAKALQNLTYTWDAIGNQITRRDQGMPASGTAKNLQQSFCYDSLNRLLKTHQGTLAGSCALTAAQQDQEYDSFGNITRKSGIGAYIYRSRPHQLAGTGDGVTYNYDAVGNLLSDSSGRTLAYSVFDKPLLVAKGTNRIAFGYGVYRELLKRTDTGTAGTSTTYFIGDVEKVVKPDGSYDMRRNLAGIGLWTHHFDANGQETGLDRQYVYKDVLGSVVMITNDRGVSKQQYAYDAWGRRVAADNWTAETAVPTPVSSQLTAQGFTGHEMLDAMGLIHMQGRIYDQRLGRFIQADPIVQMPRFLQSYNRYSYVFNAPLKFTDPTGFNGAGDDMNTWANSLGRGGLGGDISQVVVEASRIAGYSSSFSGFDGSSPASFSGYSGFSFNNAAIAVPVGTSKQSVAGRGNDFEGNTANPRQRKNDTVSPMTGRAAQGVSGASGETVAGQVAEGVRNGYFDRVVVECCTKPEPVVPNAFTRLPDMGQVLIDFFDIGTSLGGSVGLLKGMVVAGMAKGATSGTEIVYRWMSKSELKATQESGLLRGGREGTHYVTDAANDDAIRARLRLSLPQTPDVRVKMEVPINLFSKPSKVEPAFNMLGGGMERTAVGAIPVRILEVQ